MNSARVPAFIHGAAVTMSWADSSRSLPDLIFQGVSAGLANARIEMAQVDSVVLAAHDLVDGLSLSSMVTSPAAGAYLRDEIRLAEDGLVAASLGAARVTAGESKFTVVAAWGRTSEGDLLNTSRAAMDPFLLQPLGMTELDISALRLSAWLQHFSARDASRAEAAASRRGRAHHNPRALHQPTVSFPLSYPLREGEGPQWADIVVAMVLGRKETGIRISGIGHSTDKSSIADRDLLAMPALKEAAARAAADASTAIDKVDIVEIDGMTLADEALALEALKLCAPGEGFSTLAKAAHFNPSGGGAAGWCYPAMGLVRLAECYLQLTKAAGGVQQGGTLKTALALGASPVGAQSRTAIMLEAQ